MAGRVLRQRPSLGQDKVNNPAKFWLPGTEFPKSRVHGWAIKYKALMGRGRYFSGSLLIRQPSTCAVTGVHLDYVSRHSIYHIQCKTFAKL